MPTVPAQMPNTALLLLMLIYYHTQHPFTFLNHWMACPLAGIRQCKSPVVVMHADEQQP